MSVNFTTVKINKEYERGFKLVETCQEHILKYNDDPIKQLELDSKINTCFNQIKEKIKLLNSCQKPIAQDKKAHLERRFSRLQREYNGELTIQSTLKKYAAHGDLTKDLVLDMAHDVQALLNEPKICSASKRKLKMVQESLALQLSIFEPKLLAPLKGYDLKAQMESTENARIFSQDIQNFGNELEEEGFPNFAHILHGNIHAAYVKLGKDTSDPEFGRHVLESGKIDLGLLEQCYSHTKTQVILESVLVLIKMDGIVDKMKFIDGIMKELEEHNINIANSIYGKTWDYASAKEKEQPATDFGKQAFRGLEKVNVDMVVRGNAVQAIFKEVMLKGL